MATLTITNISGDTVNLGDFYIELGAGLSVDVERSASDIPNLAALAASVAAGDVTMSVAYTADEIASGFQSPPQAVEAEDVAPAPTAGIGAFGGFLIHAAFAAGGGGSPDDVTIYAVNALPFTMRILDAWAKVSTAVGASTLEVNDEPAAAGTTVATFDSATTGARIPTTAPLTSIFLAPGAAKGLFVRRSDDGVAGEVTMLAIREDAP